VAAGDTRLVADILPVAACRRKVVVVEVGGRRKVVLRRKVALRRKVEEEVGDRRKVALRRKVAAVVDGDRP
jgi:hypothetical protein